MGVDSLEKKVLREIGEEYFGAGHGSRQPAGVQKICLYVALHITPRFQRTHVVKIVRMSNGEFVLICPCPCWEQHGRACRHMYAVPVLQRHPTVRDAKIRWHIGYAHEYRVNDASSVKYLELRDKFACQGVPLAVEDVGTTEPSVD